MPTTVCVGYIALIIAGVLAVVAAGLISVISMLATKGHPSKRSCIKGSLITFLVLPIVFCGSFWLLGNFLYSGMYPPTPRQRPMDKDIIGTWELSEDSLVTIEEEGYAISTHTLTFSSDKTFEMLNLPYMVWDPFGEAGGKFISGSGTWNVEKDASHDWAIRVHYKATNLEEKESNTYLNLAGKAPPYSIYLWIDDPDTGRIITYIKK